MIYSKYIKRLLSIILSLTAIIILSPVMLVTAIIVRTKLGKPVIYSAARPGLYGKLFKMYKFRTMTTERDAEGNLLPDPQRLTKTGKILRKLSLDELPELFNILKGDMSFVGPRPLLVRYLDIYSEEQSHRHDVRPGFTNLAAVRGRNSLPWEEVFALDVYYTQHVTFAMDFKIFILTIKTVLCREGNPDAINCGRARFTGQTLESTGKTLEAVLAGETRKK